MLWKVRESGLGATARVPGAARRAGRAGRTRPCRPSSSAPTCATSASCSTSTATTASLYGHFGQGCIHYADRLRPAARAEASSSYRAFIDEAARPRRRATAARSPASTATASRAASCLPKMFGARADRRLRRVQGDLGSRRQDEPGQGGRRRTASTRTCGSAPTTTRRSSRRTSSSPTTSGSFAYATERCVGVGECRQRRAAARCARATW